MNMKTTGILLAAMAGLFLSAGASMASNMALMEPVRSVFDHYLKIQADLANDSLKGVPAEAHAIAGAVQGESMKMLPDKVATEAETLAKASDLKSARTAFKALSNSLVKYLDQHHAKSAYVEVYCPMARASWLQTNRAVNNPYLGQEMPTCGEIKN
ncbi:MAG: DUF3347 domain-containing protein [Verrucomicrobiota bacterium]|nr:DUF3347 domain-containing protein [Verrucomicrobiota bacterium]